MRTDRIGSHEKAIWPAFSLLDSGETVESYVAEGHSLFDGSISWPAMILRGSALDANIATLAAFCTRHGLDFAPHGKTSMAPALFERQLAAGAWGITFATAHQARLGFDHGVQRVLLANQLLDSTALSAIVGLLLDDPAREFLGLVDSVEGVRAIAAVGARNPGLSGGLAVLIDVGWHGGRTGVRTTTEALKLARLVAETPHIRLAGVSSYEGGLKTPDAVTDYFARVREVVDAIASAGLVQGRMVVTAGGSAYFDLVASELAGDWASGRDVQLILRSGAYASHDDGTYLRKTAFNRIPEEGHLEAAIEVWAQVLSVPEPGLAIVGMGKRDAPYDSGMPVPLRLRRDGASEIEDIRGRAVVPAMDDQHGYLNFGDDLEMRPGDLVGFGISHPCTAFDKWRWLPVLDDNDRVVDLLKTYF